MDRIDKTIGRLPDAMMNQINDCLKVTLAVL